MLNTRYALPPQAGPRPSPETESSSSLLNGLAPGRLERPLVKDQDLAGRADGAALDGEGGSNAELVHGSLYGLDAIGLAEQGAVGVDGRLHQEADLIENVHAFTVPHRLVAVPRGGPLRWEM